MFCFLPFYLFHVISWILGSLLSLPQVYLHNYCFLEWRQWHPTPVLLPGKSQGWRSLVGCSPWVSKSRTWLSDLTFTFYFHALEKELATHSSVLAWRIPGTGEPGGLPSMGSHRVGDDWATELNWEWFKFKEPVLMCLICEKFNGWAFPGFYWISLPVFLETHLNWNHKSNSRILGSMADQEQLDLAAGRP